jgi:archaellum component FlaG (FlaF/FlaG flagellin family)
MRDMALYFVVVSVWISTSVTAAMSELTAHVAKTLSNVGLEVRPG